MDKNDEIRKKSSKCLKSLKEISLIKVKEEEKRKKVEKKRYQSKSPLRPSKQETLQTEPDNIFDASDISDIEKLILNEKKRNKSARKSIHRVANELNDYYVTSDLLNSPKKQNIPSLSSEHNTEYYIQYSLLLEKQYADTEKNNEELVKKLQAYSELESNYHQLKVDIIKYNQFKSISSAFNIKEEKDKNMASYQSNKEVLYNLYGSNNIIKNSKNSFLDVKKNKNDLKNKTDSAMENDSANIYKCENSKCQESLKLYEELRKLTLRLKYENENWIKRCLDLGGDLLTIKELQNSREKSIIDK